MDESFGLSYGDRWSQVPDYYADLSSHPVFYLELHHGSNKHEIEAFFSNRCFYASMDCYDCILWYNLI